jgi:hypothetical protein
MLILYAGRYRFSPANAAIAQESRLTEKELEDYMVSLDRDTGPTAYACNGRIAAEGIMGVLECS